MINKSATQIHPHTPGPWKVILAPLQIITDDELIANVSSENERKYANARLLAAAPNMLETLKDVQAWFERFAPVADLINGKQAELPMLTFVKMAIAKAESVK